MLYLDSDYMPTIKPVSDGYILMAVEDNALGKLASEYMILAVKIIDGVMVNVSVFRDNNYTLMYMKLKEANRFKGILTQKIGGAITGNLTCWYKKFDQSGYDDLESIIGQEKLRKIKNFKYKYKLKNKINKKITQFHHLHTRLVDIYSNKDEVVLKGSEALLAMNLDRFNDVESTHVTFLLYYLSLPHKEKTIFVNLLITYGVIDRSWLKREGAMSKQSQNGTKYDLSKLFELNVLENRVDEEIDWDKEKHNRIEPVTVPVTYGQVHKLSLKLFYDAKRAARRPMKMSWEDYWAQRAVIMPNGAVHSKYVEDLNIIKKLPFGAKNKKGFCSVMEKVEQSHFLNRCPSMTAHVSTKYEWGKTRALYGCDITSHVNADFGLMCCEDTFPEYVPTGSNAKPLYVKEQIKQMTGVPLCYDYDDFNSQHSVQSMQAVIDAWLVVYSELLSEEQKQAVVWTRNSIDEMYVVNNINNDTYRAQGTLFSGWRLTSFINTALNYVYLDIADKDSDCYKSIHNGDDVYASAKSIGNALALIERADKLGARAQTLKMNIGTIAEFLRMDVRAENATLSQYLTRGCATFVHSRIELDAPYSLRNLVSSYQERYNEVIQRGACGRVVRDAYRKQLFFSRKLFEVEKDVIDALLTYDLSAGGLVKNGIVTNKKIIEVEIDLKTDKVDELKTLTHQGISSYTTFLKSKFATIKDAFSYRAVENNLLLMYNVYKKSCVIEDADMLNIINERALTGAWSAIRGMTVVHKVRMGISNIVIAMQQFDPAFAKVLASSGEPVKWMRILL